MKIETDGRLKLPVFINAGLKNQHLHDIVMKTTGKLKKRNPHAAQILE